MRHRVTIVAAAAAALSALAPVGSAAASARSAAGQPAVIAGGTWGKARDPRPGRAEPRRVRRG